MVEKVPEKEETFLIFVIKTSNYLPFYVFIMTGFTLVGQLVLWFRIKVMNLFVPISFKQIQKK